MSLYNTLNGFNAACVFILPLLGRHSDEYPRFRDCYVDADDNSIVIYTRVGGGNRNCGFGEEELYEDPNFINTWDDDFDRTYGSYKFRCPDKWKTDFDNLLNSRFSDTSQEYRDLVKSFYPSLSDKLDEIFSKKSSDL